MAIDPAAKLEEMRAKLGLTFPLVLDPESAIIRSYGLLNEEQGQLPHPATLVIDRTGTVRWMEINVNYRERPASETVLAALEALGSADAAALKEAPAPGPE